MSDVEQAFKDLSSYVRELESKFIEPYLPADPATPPSAYAHDVKAFCVLSHAAFEEFAETVVLTVAAHSVDQWINARKINDVIPALLVWHGAKLKIDDGEKNAETKPFDYLRPLVDEARASFSREVYKNHGISIIYMRKLFIPVAIEIKQDANLLNSLSKLAKGRGDYAHKGRVKVVLAPEDAKRLVKDVIELFDDIRANAILKMS